MNYLEAAKVDAMSRTLNLLRRLDDMFFRGTGRTTNAILTCPLNSIYVCPSAVFGYYRVIANECARRDVRLVAPSFITTRRCRGIDLKETPIVFDHATTLSLNEWNDFYMDVCYV